MNGTEIALIITALATFLTAVGSLIIGLKTVRKVEQVHVATNSKMDKLLEVTGAAEKAKGVQEGLEQARGEMR